MRDEEIVQRIKKIYDLDKKGDKQESINQFKELMQDTISWCTYCRRYRHIELDKATSDKPFYFCVDCGQRIKKLRIHHDSITVIKFHKLK